MGAPDATTHLGFTIANELLRPAVHVRGAGLSMVMHLFVVEMKKISVW